MATTTNATKTTAKGNANHNLTTQPNPNPAPAPNMQAIITQMQALVASTASPATVHNALLQAVKLAQSLPQTPAQLTLSASGYNCGGWRKPALQMVANAFGLAPVLVHYAKPVNPNNPKVIGQQPAFYGPANVAQVASAYFAALFTWANVQGNKALRVARAQGKAAGKTGQAGNRLQENVYNNIMAQILDSIASNTPNTTNPATTTNMAQMVAQYKPTASKGGIVFSGAYNTTLYNGQLLQVASTAINA